MKHYVKISKPYINEAAPNHLKVPYSVKKTLDDSEVDKGLLSIRFDYLKDMLEADRLALYKKQIVEQAMAIIESLEGLDIDVDKVIAELTDLEIR